MRSICLAIALVVAVTLLGMAGCIVTSRPAAISRAKLVGTYEMTFPAGHSSLRLDANGRFTQEIEIGREKVSATGTWSHSTEEWFADMTLHDCLLPMDGFGRLNEGWRTPFSGAVVMPITRRFVVGGPIEIVSDEEYPYIKRE